MTILTVLGASLLLVLAVAACGGDSYGGGGSKSSDDEGTTTTIAGMEAESHGTKDVSDETGKVEVEMYDSYFEPTVLQGKPGQKVTLELKNEGKLTHNFKLADQNVDQDVEPADEAEVEVTIPQSGTIAFECKFHESSGMVGGLEASG
jgi:plastocyanin